ncbi:hypothetical protein L3X38_020275 [Prunus dulcis]|uniref:Uncharacterized protein n=1 Tax=Prunus dulcis TaxID=3755 RepID=A0AAD4ZCW2_PRUDU|nr:hypothetical protein L3X38_020275 [Prunus dulcis]
MSSKEERRSKGEGLGDIKSIRAANWQDSGDHSQPDPLAGLGDTKSTRAANPGRSRDTKSSRAANPGRSWDTKSIRAANHGRSRDTKSGLGTPSQSEPQILAGLGTPSQSEPQILAGLGTPSQSEPQILAGLGTPSQSEPQILASTVRAFPKLVRQMSSALTKLRVNWMSVDISITEGHVAGGERSGKEEDVVPVVLVPAQSTAVVGGRRYEGEKGRKQEREGGGWTLLDSVGPEVQKRQAAQHELVMTETGKVQSKASTFYIEALLRQSGKLVISAV